MYSQEAERCHFVSILPVYNANYGELGMFISDNHHRQLSTELKKAGL